jgi:nickel-type superoxide dismutase maturation protease
MAPALRHGDQLLVRRAVRARPGDVVVVSLPDGVLAVKRLRRPDDGAGLWVEGDNPYGSTDSRTFGSLPSDALLGVAMARLWPHPRVLRAGANHAR